ncbi:MAG: HD domain-containing protein [Actinobacteria bacterium]|nr:MAG: HD domain-containing protein [Actinomycetota bacterium]
MSAADAVPALPAARRAVQLSPPTHPAFDEAIGGLVAAAQSTTLDGPFVLNWHQGRLYHESVVIPEEAHGQAAVSEAFESRSIESLTLSPEFGNADALGLVEVLSLRPSPTLDVQAELNARGAHAVTVAMLEDEDDEEREERDRQRQADRAMYTRVISALRRLQQQFAAAGSGDIGQTVPLVAGVIERLAVDPSAVLGLATIRGASEHDLYHSLNVMIYAVTLGQKLGLPEEGLSSLGLSALLHDVGKAAFVVEDQAQREPMRLLHPKIGAEILQRAALEDPAPMLVAFEHHMHADGTGWPEREEGYFTHPYSRMVAIANRYENLTNPSDGSNALTPDRGVVQVLRESSSTLDPFFSRLFASALGVFPIGCLVRLSDQTVGVVAAHGEDPLAPVVRLAYDARGAELDDPAEIDLSTGDVRIVEVIDPDALRLEVSEKL